MKECDLGEMSSPASASSAVPLRLEAGGERGELGDEMGTWKAGCPPPRLSSRAPTGHHARCCDSSAVSGQLSWALPGAFPEFLLPHRYYPAPLIPGLNSATARWQLVGEGSEGPDDRTRRCSCLLPAGGPRDPWTTWRQLQLGRVGLDKGDEGADDRTAPTSPGRTGRSRFGGRQNLQPVYVPGNIPGTALLQSSGWSSPWAELRSKKVPVGSRTGVTRRKRRMLTSPDKWIA